MIAGIIDAHAHVFSNDLHTYPYRSAKPNVYDFSATAEDYIRLMDENNIVHAVLAQPGAYGSDHSYLTSVIRRYPEKFTAFYTATLTSPDALDQLYGMVEQGYKGMRLNPLGQGDSWLDDPLTYPLWEAAERLGIMVRIFLGPHQASKLEPMLSRYPNVPVIIDHLGRAKAAEMPSSFKPILNLANYPNTYLMVSSIPAISAQPYPYRDVSAMIEMALNTFGSQRLMWAADYPSIVKQCGYREALALFYTEMPFLDDTDRAHMLGETCRKLLFDR